MLSTSGIKSLNQLLSVLNVNSSEKIISIKENGNIDANFIVTHLMKQILHENNKICLLMLHNTLDHYQNVGRKLGYDFQSCIKDNKAATVYPLQNISDDEDIEMFLLEDKEIIIKSICQDIHEKINTLKNNFNGIVYFIIDDVSHLLDLGIDLKYILSFVNSCVNMTSDRVAIVINSHVCTKYDIIISNNLSYVSDVNIEVSPLYTGNSTDVTGTINVERTGDVDNKKVKVQCHYKAFDRGIKTFSPGESVQNLYK